MLLKNNYCPNCGVELSRVRQGILGTPCGLFHIYPGIAQLVIDVVNGVRPDIQANVEGGSVSTQTFGDDVHEDVEAAVIAVLDDMHEVIFPPD